MKKRVVVTGLGVVSCFGHQVDPFFQSLLQGKSGASLITTFPCDAFTTKFAAPVKEFDVEEYLDKKVARRVDKFISYAVVAGKKALEMANVNLGTLDLSKAGVLIGSGMGGMETFADGVLTLQEKEQEVSPFFVPFILTNMGGALLAKDLGFMGPNYSISTACATGTNAIIAAANHIRLHDADLMICGGVEAPIIPMGLAGFSACHALSKRNEDPTKASRPWDKDRDGFLLGEGAGILVLESLEHAVKRGATILAEYLGGASSCDAHHITEPRHDGKGVSLCIKKALQDAGKEAEAVNYVNAHATSTLAGDMVEIEAVKQVLKDPSKVVMNATKSMIGHTLGAAGGIEAVVTVKSIMEGVVHPTINLDHPEENIPFHLPKREEKLKIDVALSNSFGFGGHNATIVFSPFKP